MKLPNEDKALIQREKIADYLLNASHPDNNGKAEFFESFDSEPDAEFQETVNKSKAMLNAVALAETFAKTS